MFILHTYLTENINNALTTTFRQQLHPKLLHSALRVSLGVHLRHRFNNLVRRRRRGRSTTTTDGPVRFHLPAIVGKHSLSVNVVDWEEEGKVEPLDGDRRIEGTEVDVGVGERVELKD